MTDLDLKSLRLLVAVCDRANIKAAAADAHIEPSAISKRIAQLEAAVGTPLLRRHRRGVEPTAAGLALVEHARNLLFTADRIHADLAAFGRGIKGQVKLVASASAIAQWLLDDIAEFMREDASRDIQVDIEERVSRDVVRIVAQGGASLGVCWDDVDFQGLDRRAYRRDELALAVPRGHPLARRRTVAFDQTLDHDHVGLPPETAVHTMLGRAAARAGRSIRYRAIVSNFDAELRVVAAGLGISVTPRRIAERYAPLYGIRVVGLADPFAQRRFAVCSRDPAFLQPAALRLAGFLAGRADG